MQVVSQRKNNIFNTRKSVCLLANANLAKRAQYGCCAALDGQNGGCKVQRSRSSSGVIICRQYERPRPLGFHKNRKEENAKKRPSFKLYAKFLISRDPFSAFLPALYCPGHRNPPPADNNGQTILLVLWLWLHLQSMVVVAAITFIYSFIHSCVRFFYPLLLPPMVILLWIESHGLLHIYTHKGW